MGVTTLQRVVNEQEAILYRYMTIVPVEYHEISDFVDRFCETQNVRIGQLATINHHKRILFAVSIRMFHPSILSGTHCRRLRNGIISGLASKLGIKPNYLKDNSKAIIFHYTQYQWFKEIVDDIYDKMKNK